MVKYQRIKKVKKKKINLKEKLWKLFSEFIRLRDANNGYVSCISCGKVTFWKDCDAGHFIAKNSGMFFYFNEDDVHGQCGYCNRFLHGNLLNYRRRLVEKIGLDEVEKLEYQSQIGIRDELNATCKYTDEEYKDLINIYKDKINELKGLKSWERQ